MTKHEQYAYEVEYSQSGPRGLARKPRKMHNPVFGPALIWTLAIFALILALVVLAFATGFVTIFEDGSYKIGLQFPWLFSGCLPGGLCNF